MTAEGTTRLVGYAVTCDGVFSDNVVFVLWGDVDGTFALKQATRLKSDLDALYREHRREVVPLYVIEKEQEIW